MTLAELKQLIAEENARLRARFPEAAARRETWVLAQAVKMTEELGELCRELLASLAFQRADHSTMDGHHAERLRDEFADVIITAFLAAETMGVDVEMALQKKLETIRQRAVDDNPQTHE